MFVIHFLGGRPPILLAVYALSILLFNGQIHAEDINDAAQALDSGRYQQARESLEALARNGSSDAQTLLGIMYSEGKGVTHDLPQARHWLTRAAHQGNNDAQFLLGLSYLGNYGNTGTATGHDDLAKARIWLRRSAHNNNPLAQGFLVRAYKNAWFGSINLEHASYWQQRLQSLNESSRLR